MPAPVIYKLSYFRDHWVVDKSASEANNQPGRVPSNTWEIVFEAQDRIVQLGDMSPSEVANLLINVDRELSSQCGIGLFAENSSQEEKRRSVLGEAESVWRESWAILATDTAKHIAEIHE